MLSVLKEYFLRVKREFNIISWPSREQVYEATILVLLVTIVVAAVIGALDLILNKLFFLFIR